MTHGDNLISLGDRDKEARRAIASKGGKASGKSRRKKANLKKALSTILESQVQSPELAKKLEEMGFENSNESAMMLILFQKALKGDMRAIELIAKMISNEKDEYDVAEQKERTKLLKQQVEKGKAEIAALRGEGTESVVIVDEWKNES